MVKSYRGVLSLICCLLLATAFALPLAAQQSTAPQSPTPGSDVNRDLNLDTQPSTQPNTPSDQYNSQPSTAPETQPNLDREKPSDSDIQQQDREKPSDSDMKPENRDDSGSDPALPRTATGMPLVGLIGAASLFGSAIRRRYF